MCKMGAHVCGVMHMSMYDCVGVHACEVYVCGRLHAVLSGMTYRTRIGIGYTCLVVSFRAVQPYIKHQRLATLLVHLMTVAKGKEIR